MITIKFRVNEEISKFGIKKGITEENIDEVINKLFGEAAPLIQVPPKLTDLTAEQLVELLESYYVYVRNIKLGDRLMPPQEYKFGEVKDEVVATGEVTRVRDKVGIVSVENDGGVDIPYFTLADFAEQEDSYGDQIATEAEVRALIKYVLGVDRLSKVSLKEFITLFEVASDNGETSYDREEIVGIYEGGQYTYYGGIMCDEDLGRELVENGEFGNVDSELYSYINFDGLGYDQEYYYSCYGAVKLD